MALATSTIIALGLAAAAAGTNYYNTQQTAKRQDSQLATSIRNQGAKQKEADAKVNDEVARLESSRSADEQAGRLGDFMNTLRVNKGRIEGGLTPEIGSEAFRGDAATAAGRVQEGAAKSASLLSRIDAAGMQRQGEAFGYGRLGTDLGLIGREAKGQSFLDELRLRAIRRNAGLDAAAALMGGAASGIGAGGATAGASSGATNVGNAFFAGGGLGGYGY